jgi:hypothetical protein
MRLFSGEMTSKERVRAAMAGGSPDCVPLMCQMSFGHMLLQTDFSPSAFWNSAEIYAAGLLAMRQTYNFDGILISLHGHSPDWEKKVSRVRKEGIADVIYWKNGDRTVFPSDDLPLHYPVEPRQRLSLSEFDPESLGPEIALIPVSQGLEFYFDPEHLYDVIDIIVEKAGADYSIHGEVTSPFDYFLNLFDVREALMGLIEEPAKVKAILQRFTEAVKKIACGLVAHNVDAVKVSSPYSGAGFISPLFYREFVLPYESQIAQAVTSRGVPAYIHTCGKIHDRLEMMVEAGFSGIECLDPPPLGNVELADAKKRIGEKAFIKGNIDPVNVLLAGTAELVRKDTRRRLETGKRGGRYILSTACSIAPQTKRGNIQILAEVVEEAGSYY